MKTIKNKLGLVIALIAFLGLTSCSTAPNNSGASTTVGSTNTGDTDTTGSTTQNNKEYVVQLFATANASKAANIKKTFAIDEGYDNVMISTITLNGKKIHRIQIGPYASKTASTNMLNQMKRRYHKNQYVNGAVVKTIYGK